MAAQLLASREDASPPPRKRMRQEKTINSATSKPRLFAPFRALGLVTNHVPFVLQARSHKGATEGPRVHILTCLGRAWALWEGGKMNLLFVGSDAPELISSMALDGDAVWAASGSHVIKYIRGKEVQRLSNPLSSALSYILIFGTSLLALTEDGTKMINWNTVDGELQSTVEFDPDFSATSILHPATYLNKVLVASRQGSLKLWNIKSNVCIHTFSSTSLSLNPTTTNDSAITTVIQSPAIDVVGIGFASGEIVVHDVRTDERLMRMFMEGGVRAIAFRNDGHPILASASSAGHIALWDLNEGGRLLHVIRGAHDGAVTAVEWIPGQPVLVTSGEDNAVKQWLFDSPTAVPRLLKFRSGHHAPPHLIRYYGEDGKQLLTASRDRSLRFTSVVRDSRSFEMSQGSIAKKATSLSIPLTSLKFPPISSISFSTARAKDWDDVLTAHADETFVRTWTTQNKKVGKYSFGFAELEKGKAKDRETVGSAKALCVTACGNFGIAGSSTGQIYMWNMQSGVKRKTFDVGSCPAEAANRFGGSMKKKSGRTISGLASDALNTIVIASTLDGTLNFFDFHTSKLDHTMVIPSTIVSILLHRDSGLLALVCDDMVVRIVDIETKRIVRELGGFRGRVLDITFSPDSRWLVTTSLDAIIRTFDVPTGRLIDAFRTPSVATSISISPTNDFLATAHVDSVGVFLWANRAQYGEVSFQTVVNDEISDVSMPSLQGTVEDEALSGLSALTVEDAPTDIFSTPEQLEDELVTLTLLPRARWQTLLNLDVIQLRNKPKEPPKAPEQAPFFLPTLPGVEQRFVPKEKTNDAQASEKPTRRLEKAAAHIQSVFLQKLSAEEESGDYENFFIYAKSLSPAALDLELRSLTTLDSLQLFIKALTRRLHSRRDFEAVQALQNVFLRQHGEVIVANEELLEHLENLSIEQKRESERVLELVASSLGTLGFVRDTL